MKVFHFLGLFYFLNLQFFRVNCQNEKLFNQRSLSLTIKRLEKAFKNDYCSLVYFLTNPKDDILSIFANEVRTRLVCKEYTQKMSVFLKDRFSCIILLIDDPNQLDNGLKLLQYKSKAYILLLDDLKKVTFKKESRLQRKVFGFNQISQSRSIVSSLCSDWSVNLIDLWKKDQGFINGDLDLTKTCPIPLKNTQVNVSYALAKPGIIMPKHRGGRLKGFEVEIMRLLAEKFNFIPKFKLKGFEQFDLKNKRFRPGGVIHSIENDQSTFGIGILSFSYFRNLFIDYSYPLSTISLVWGTRHPQMLKSYGGFTKPFSKLIWSLIYFSITCIVITFGITYWTYKKKLTFEKGLIRGKVPFIEFLLTPFVRFVEPDPIKWFPRYSAGKLLVMLWSVFCTFILFFYQSNLRANLINPQFEKPLNYHQDVLDRGQTVYIPYTLNNTINHKFRPDLSEKLKKISILAHERRGFYSLFKNRGLVPDYARKDIMENGASYITFKSTVLYEYLESKDQGLPNIHLSQDDIYFYSIGFYMKKYTPWKEEIDQTLSHLREMGFVDYFLTKPIPIEALKKKPESKETKKINVSHIKSLLYFLIIMLSICLIVFVLEFILPDFTFYLFI